MSSSSASSFLASSVSSNLTVVGEEEMPDTGLSTVQIILAIVIFTIMLGVGMAIDKVLFKHIIVTKKAVFACVQGVCQQFILMPLVALALAQIFWDRDDPNWKYQALGIIMLGIVPGGTTSNAITTMSGGVLELSIFMTVCSTVVGFGMTPLWLYIMTKIIGIDNSSMDFATLALGFVLLLVPLIIGAVISWLCPKVKKHIETVIGVLTVIFVIIALVFVCIENAGPLADADWRLHVPACFFFLISSSLGYVLSANVFGNAPAVNRTIFLEVGLQNTTLVYALIEITLRYKSQRDRAAPFPILYTIWMFFWSFVFCAIFRQYKKYNEEHDIADNDPDLDRMVSGMAALKKQEEEEGENKEEGNGAREDKELEEGSAATGAESENSSNEPIPTSDEPQTTDDNPEKGEQSPEEP